MALFIFSRVRHHDGTLGSPEKTSTNTEESSSEDVEATNRGVDRDKQADCVEAVASTSESEAGLDAELVDESTAEEGEDCKSRVQCSVLSHMVVSEGSDYWKLRAAKRDRNSGSRTILSASWVEVFPPPPRPPRALNMPGHIKQTKATRTSWNLG